MFWSKLSVEKLDRKGKPVYNNRVSPQGLSTTSGTTSDARALSLGDGVAALDNGVNSMADNPAGLAHLSPARSWAPCTARRWTA